MLPPAPTPTPAPTPAAPAPGPAPSVKEPAAPPPAAASAALLSPPIEARRFRTDAFSVAGIAYDGVSQRFLFGDHLGRKLRVVSDRSDHSVDLARAESGGFRDIAALAIDDRRGDLWVASAGEGDTSGLLHKLQLISGRPLKSFPISADGHPVQPADLAVAPSGTILVLDAGSPRLLALRPGRTDLELITRLEDSGPASVTIGKDEDIAYVAHGHEIARVMMHGGRTTALPFREKIALGRLECIRLYRRSIIAIERNGESRRVLRLELNDRGTAIDKVVPLAEQLPATGRISAAIADDALVYVIDGDPSAPSSAGDVVVYRVALL